MPWKCKIGINMVYYIHAQWSRLTVCKIFRPINNHKSWSFTNWRRSRQSLSTSFVSRNVDEKRTWSLPERYLFIYIYTKMWIRYIFSTSTSFAKNCAWPKNSYRFNNSVNWWKLRWPATQRQWPQRMVPRCMKQLDRQKAPKQFN